MVAVAGSFADFILVADLVGPVFARAKKEKVSLPDWRNTYSLVATLSRRMQDIMRTMDTLREPEVILVRKGDLDPAAVNPMAIAWPDSVILAAYSLLIWSTVAPNSAERRFQRMPDERDLGYFYGFHADDWMRAFYALYAF